LQTANALEHTEQSYFPTDRKLSFLAWGVGMTLSGAGVFLFSALCSFINTTTCDFSPSPVNNASIARHHSRDASNCCCPTIYPTAQHELLLLSNCSAQNCVHIGHCVRVAYWVPNTAIPFSLSAFHPESFAPACHRSLVDILRCFWARRHLYCSTYY